MGKGVDLVTREEAKFGKVSWPSLRRLFIYFFSFSRKYRRVKPRHFWKDHKSLISVGPNF